METIEIKIQEQEDDVQFTIVRHQKHSSEREKVFCDGWVKLVESIILTSQTLTKQYSLTHPNLQTIDLKDAIIAWTSNGSSEDGIRRLKVFKKWAQIIPQEYLYTDGACYSYWQESDYQKQVDFIQLIATNLINEYEFTPKEVHDAFLSITEYFVTPKDTGIKTFKLMF